MKNIIILAILFLASPRLRAQLVIENGALFNTTGAAVITLQHTNLINNGTYAQATGGKTIFAGTGNDTIMGTASILSGFDTLEIAKSGTGRVVLLQDLKNNGGLKFTSGIIDLHGHVISLLQNAVLVGESEASYITDTVYGGYITTSRTLNAPAAVNPGNLGAIITSAQNMGVTTIRRGHMAQANGNNTGNSIKRYYDITPANNTNLGATLRILYRDAELNGITESALDLWKSTDTVVWTNAGSSSKNATSNYVEQTGIADFSRWTLSALNSPLPLLLTRFIADCDQGNIKLDWITAQEHNVSHFEVQRSPDARSWTHIATVAFEEAVHNYSYAAREGKEGYYRLMVQDRDGHHVYSDVQYVSCASIATDITIWPNPVADQLYLAVAAATASDMVIRVYDAKGGLIYQGNKALQPGDNKLNLDFQNFAAGIYWLNIDWNMGASRKTLKVVKQ